MGEVRGTKGAVRPLSADQLYRASELSRLAFVSTAELEPIDGMIGQARALEAVEFGTKIDKAGFNLFVIGGTGVGMRDAVKAMLAEEARTRPGPSDWVYVNNFAKPDRPVAIELPSGRAAGFKDAMHKLIEDLKSAAPAAFQSEDYQTRRGAIDEAFQKISVVAVARDKVCLFIVISLNQHLPAGQCTAARARA